MVNKNKTIINNKNIIQICSDIKPRRRKQPKQSYQNTSAQHINTRDNPTLYTPLNNFPNSSSLDDQSRKVRFMEAMRDPTATKSPYSLFDNGSNTFERQGNTQGSERAIVRPQISQDTYFSAPRAASSRPIQRFSLSSPYDFNDDLSDTSEQPQGLSLQRLTEQEDENEIPLYVSSDPTSHNSWFGPEMQEQQQDDDISPPEARDISELFGISGAQYLQPETRFSPYKLDPPPSFSTPFRAPADDDVNALLDVKERASERKKKLDTVIEGSERAGMYREDINGKINLQQEHLNEIQRKKELLKEKRKERTPAIAETQAIVETKRQPTMEEIRQIRIETARQVAKQQEMIKKFQGLKEELLEIKKTRASLAFTKADKEVRKKIQDLIKDEDYEFTGKEAFNKDGTRRKPSIGAISKIDTFIRFLEDGSKKHISKLKELEAPTAAKYDEQIRNPPATSGNIQTFKAAAAGGGGVAIRN
jgi:hypothetical protein